MSGLQAQRRGQMDITIKINCDNAAFEEDAMCEVTSILQEWLKRGVLADRKLRDTNGNIVGQVEVEA